MNSTDFNANDDAATLRYIPEAGALDARPQVAPERTINLDGDLQAQFLALTSYDLNNSNVLALRRAIADQLNIPWIAIHIEPGRVVRRDIQRGDHIILPEEWRARINESQRNGNYGALIEMQNEVARFTGLLFSHVSAKRRSGEWTFYRSFVPNTGEIADGSSIAIPESARDGLAHIRTSDDLDEHFRGESLIDEISQALKLPPGRIVLELNRGVIRCIYREPVAGALLRLPHSLHIEILRIFRYPDHEHRVQTLTYFVAKHFGLEPTEIIIRPPIGGQVEVLFAPLAPLAPLPSPKKVGNSLPKTHEALKVPQALMDLLKDVERQYPGIEQVVSAEVHAALDLLIAEVALHNGLDASEIEIVRTSDGRFEFRRKLEARPSIQPAELAVHVNRIPHTQHSLIDSDSESVLDTGAIIGIAAGSLVLVFCCIFAIRRARRTKS